ncbi:MAG: calcium-binding protein [Pseudomonadota bacterium]
MSLTKSQFDILAAGGNVSFGLPTDPGPGSADGIFFSDFFFDTATGDQDTTAQGLSALTSLDDIFERGDSAEFIIRNATVDVGDDFGLRDGLGGLISISGAAASLNLDGNGGGSYRIRIDAHDARDVSGTIFVSDGADIVFGNDDPGTGRGFAIGRNTEPEIDGGSLVPGGQSVDGTLVIEGTGTTVSVLNATDDRGEMQIGVVSDSEDGVVDTTTNRTADGLVIVRDGAEVNIRQFLKIGDADNVAGAEATGALIVEGAGTTFTLGQTGAPGNAGFMRVGEEGGTGYFVLRDGAEFNILQSRDDAGGIQFSGSSNEAGGEGHGVVTGAGTRLFVESGTIEVGRNTGTASFEVSDGAEVEANSLRVGRGGTAEGLITGAGTFVDLTNGEFNDLEVGNLDRFSSGVSSVEATLTISDGAVVDVGGFVGVGQIRDDVGGTADGTLIVEGADTSVTVGGGASSEAGFMRVAGGTGSTGTFTLRDGAEFTLRENAVSQFRAGIHFSGSNEDQGGVATATVTGAGTALTAENGFIEVGRNDGTASLLVSDGALMQARDFATAQGGTATTIIEGAGTRVILSDGNRGALDVGFVNFEDTTITNVDGTVTIRDGAEVEVRSFIGVGSAQNRDGVTANGTLIIEGSTTSVTVGSTSRTGENGFMRLGERGGNGDLFLRDGAELILLAGEEFGGGLQLSGSSDDAGGEANATITGAGTRLVAEQDNIVVGRNGGTSTFTASDGAAIEALFFNVGQEGDGDAILEGEGTLLELSGARVSGTPFGAFMTVGRDADGSVLVRDGADITITGDGGDFPGFQAGRNEGGVGVITVTGAGSTITVDGAANVETFGGDRGFMRVGREAGSDGTLNVLDGGVVTNDGEGRIIVAELDGSTGRVTVDGAGSVFDFGASAFFSQDAPAARGNAIVTVSNGGLLRGGEITNNGILDIHGGGTVEADVTNDNILRSSGGVQDTTITGDLTFLTGGLGIDATGFGASLSHDTYAATGAVSLEGALFVVTAQSQNLSGQTLEILTGSNLSVGAGFSVHIIDFDPNAILEVDQSEFLAVSNAATTLQFTTSTTGLTVDFAAGEQTGSVSSETLVGTALDETVNAQEGDDTVDAGLGDDTIDAGSGNDSVDAGRGDDNVTAGDGDDDVRAGVGDDSVTGDAGDDFLRGGRGEDTLKGGVGDDSIVGQRNADTIDGGKGADNLKGGGGNDSIDGGGGNDFIKGGTRADVMNGDRGDDRIAGNAFDDVLNGGVGDDTLNAGGNDDTLNGGEGDDRLKGGSGADTFVFEPDMGADLVVDFRDDIDTLSISSVLTGGITDAGTIVTTFATVVAGDTVLDFGGGNTITLEGVANAAVLSDDIDVF